MRLQLARGRAFDALGRKKTNWETEKDRLGDRDQEIQESKGVRGDRRAKGEERG